MILLEEKNQATNEGRSRKDVETKVTKEVTNESVIVNNDFLRCIYSQADYIEQVLAES